MALYAWYSQRCGAFLWLYCLRCMILMVMRDPIHDIDSDACSYAWYHLQCMAVFVVYKASYCAHDAGIDRPHAIKWRDRTRTTSMQFNMSSDQEKRKVKWLKLTHNYAWLSHNYSWLSIGLSIRLSKSRLVRIPVCLRFCHSNHCIGACLERARCWRCLVGRAHAASDGMRAKRRRDDTLGRKSRYLT